MGFGDIVSKLVEVESGAHRIEIGEGCGRIWNVAYANTISIYILQDMLSE